MLKGLCLLAGYAFGCFLTAEIVARCLAGMGTGSIGTGSPSAANIAGHLGKPAGIAVIAGDALKTILACWFCYRLAAPELEHIAVLYGGMGVVLGHAWPLWRGGHGGCITAVACTWAIIYFPVTGALCCLAGAVAAIGMRHRALGIVLAGGLAVVVAFLQFGTQSGFGTVGIALVLIWQYRKEFLPVRYEKKEKSP